MPIAKYLTLLTLCIGLNATLGAEADDGFITAGPVYHEFSLTLSSGTRREAAGPLFYQQRSEDTTVWAFPPLFSRTVDTGTDSEEIDILYPIITYDRFGLEDRWQFFQLFSTSGGQTIDGTNKHRFTLFPFYFQQRSPEPSLNYTALLPFYGTLKNRLFRDEIFFVMMPLYVQTKKRDVVTDNYVAPFFHLRHGDNLSGWQFWPLVGSEHKGLTMRTNNYDEVQTIGGHEKFFALWPFFFNEKSGLETTNVIWQQSLLFAYSLYRSEPRDSTSILWPIFTYTDEREKKYKEIGMPWPFIGFARGEGKTMNRVWPLFSRAHNDTLESSFYAWPLYLSQAIHSPPLERRRTRILFFLYSDIMEKNTTSGDYRHRVDFWPFYTKRHDLNGDERLQVLSLIEPFTPASKSMERDWSPLWSLWRSERSLKTGATSQSLLWNLYRRDTTPTSKKCSLFFGLIQYQSTPDGSKWRWFYVPTGKSSKNPEASPNP